VFSDCCRTLPANADKLTWLRGLHTDTPAHPQAVVQLHTGSANAALTRPSMGAWLLYGLGSENQDLPGYITINPPPNFGGAVNYGALPASPTSRARAIGTTAQSAQFTSRRRHRCSGNKLDLIQSMNRDLGAAPDPPNQLDGVTRATNSVSRSGSVSQLLDISKEPRTIKEAYGVKDGPTGSSPPMRDGAPVCAKRWVRFVEICQPG